MVEELVNNSHRQMKEEEGWRIAAVDALTLAEKRIQDLNTKLTKANREKKSVEVVLSGAERQAENQRKQLRQTEDQLAIAKEQIGTLKKKLEEAKNAVERVEQEGYDIGVAETKENLRAQVSRVYRVYYLQEWNEALNQAGVDASSTLRRAENVYYPPAIRASDPLSSNVESSSKDLDLSENDYASALPSSTIPPKEEVQVGVVEKEKETTKEVALESTKLPPSPKEPSKEKEVSQSQELVLVTFPFTAKEDPKGKGATQATTLEMPTKVAAKFASLTNLHLIIFIF